MINVQTLVDLAIGHANRLPPGRRFHVRDLFQRKLWFSLDKWVKLLIGGLFYNVWSVTNRLIEYDPEDGTAIYTSR